MAFYRRRRSGYRSYGRRPWAGLRTRRRTYGPRSRGGYGRRYTTRRVRFGGRRW